MVHLTHQVSNFVFGSAHLRQKHYHDTTVNEQLGLVLFLIVLGLLVVLFCWCLWESSRRSFRGGAGGDVVRGGDQKVVPGNPGSFTGVAEALHEEAVSEPGAVPLATGSSVAGLAESAASSSANFS